MMSEVSSVGAVARPDLSDRVVLVEGAALAHAVPVSAPAVRSDVVIRIKRSAIIGATGAKA
jgi:hypothetical protein